MQIKEVCEACGLTRKAVVYYEQQAMIHPRTLENGYREYDEAMVSRLKEIMVLRQCGLSIEDIRGYLDSADKSMALLRLQERLADRRKQLDYADQCLLRLSTTNSAPEVLWQELREKEARDSILDRMTNAFPGAYGQYLAFHFGRFLTGTVDTEEKRKAYRAIMTYLDSVPEFLSEETAAWLEHVVPAREAWPQTETALQSSLHDMDAFMDEHQDFLEEYLAYKNSPAYLESEAGRMQREIQAFQSRSGYQSGLVENLRKLSPEYDAYLLAMGEANQAFLQRFPQAEKLYSDVPSDKPNL